MSKLPLPTATAPMVDARTQAPTPPWYGLLQRIADAVFGAEQSIAALPGQFETEFGAWHIEFPDNKDYRLIVNIPYGVTITSVTTRSAAGTCTATVKINTTALGGTANSVSTTEQTQSHTSANVMAAGDDLVLTISSNSSCEGMALTITGTRVLT